MKRKGVAYLLSFFLCISSIGVIPSYADAKDANQIIIEQEENSQEDIQSSQNEKTSEEADLDKNTENIVEKNEEPKLEEENINSSEEGATAVNDAEGIDTTSEFVGENPIDETNIPVMDEEGNITYVDMSQDKTVIEQSGATRAAAAKIVNFRFKSGVIHYTESVTGVAGYVAGAYGADALYLGTSGNNVKFMLAGVIGLVPDSEVQVINKADAKSISYYSVSNGKLYHYISTNVNSTNYGSSLNNGTAPAFLKSGTKYYSYDGHYFYTEDNFEMMVQDYNNGVRTHSVNATTPYYNYFQYLPLRSQSNYSSSTLNATINNKVTSNSKMKNTGNDFVNNQNTYGVNALLMAGIGANESAWGMSSIAQSKNNLFGLNAVDSSPGESANYFSSVSQCIKEFAESFLSKQYLNPQDWKHYGAFLGNKSSGMNVKYASDPYWGEKAAAMAWLLDGLSSNKDAYKYTIGIKDTIKPDNVVRVRKENTTSSPTLYKTKKNANCAFLILNNTPSNKFYKIQSEGVLNDNRDAIDSKTGVYNFQKMYAYISSDYVKIVSKGNGSKPDAETPSWNLKGIKTNISTPQPMNTSVQISADVSGNTTGLQYKFVWEKDNWKEWGVIQDLSGKNSATWKPTSGGNYTLIVDVKGTNGVIHSKSISYKILGWEYKDIITSVQSPQLTNTSVKISPSISGNTSGLKYKFVWEKDNWKEWGVIQELSAKKSATWKPSKEGNYTLIVDIKDPSGYLISKTKTFKIVSDKWAPAEMIFSKKGVEIGEAVSITQKINGYTSGNFKYKFVWQKDNWKEWGVIRDFSAKNTVTWNPQVVGNCKIHVDIKDSSGKVITNVANYEVKSGTWRFTSITADKVSPQNLGETLNLKANLSGNVSGLKYKFVWQKDNWKEWGVIQNLSTKDTAVWTPKDAGTYTILVDIRDYFGKTITYSIQFRVNAIFKSLQVTPKDLNNVGGKLNIKAVYQGSTSELQCKFVWEKDNWKEWGVIRDFSNKDNVDWIPPKEGKYTIYVDMKQGSKTVTKTTSINVGKWKYTEVRVTRKSNGTYILKPLIVGNTNGFTYKYVWQKNNWKEWGVIRDFSTNNSVEWKPKSKGTYTVLIDVKDAAGHVITKSCAYVVK